MTVLDPEDLATASPVDTAIVGIYAASPEAALIEFESCCRELAASAVFHEERRLYAIMCLTASNMSTELLPSLFREICSQKGITWCGALVIDNADEVKNYPGHPRLGFWRRPVSEALDRFINAVRSGLAITESQQRAGAVIDQDDLIAVSARRTPRRRA